MPRITRSALAEFDLAEIYHYIGVENHSPRAADRLLDSIEATLKLLAASPNMGERRPEFGADVRIFTCGSYVLFFVPIEDGIHLLRVLHGRRDFPSLFS
jgi:toxin ParE1/3/4